ncbi:MAG: chromate transporter, partial [Caldimonas sp.]
FAAYLGALLPVLAGGVAGGLAMLVAIFLPAYLLVVGALPFWAALRARRSARRAMAGVNAAVVGLLLSALVTPLATTALHSFADVALAAGACVALRFGRWPPVLVVALAAVVGWALG